MNKGVKKIAKSNSFRQLIKYGIVGAIGFVVDFGIFYILVKIFSVHYPFSQLISDVLGGNVSVNMIDTDISHLIGSVIAITNNFILNSYFTFKVTDKKIKRFLSFVGVAIPGLVLSTFLITLFIGVLGMNDFVSKILATGIVALIQFVINKFVTFRQR